jgi:hypothetical protein
MGALGLAGTELSAGASELGCEGVTTGAGALGCEGVTTGAGALDAGNVSELGVLASAAATLLLGVLPSGVSDASVGSRYAEPRAWASALASYANGDAASTCSAASARSRPASLSELFSVGDTVASAT